MIYDKLLMLKRLEADSNVFSVYGQLNQRVDEKSKNILVICRSVKEAREAIRVVKDDADEYHASESYILMGERRIYFLPIKEALRRKLRYQKYYLDEMWGGGKR